MPLPQEEDNSGELDAVRTPAKRMRIEKSNEDCCLDTFMSPESAPPVQRSEYDLGVYKIPTETITSDVQVLRNSAGEKPQASGMCQMPPKVKVCSVYTQTTGRLAPYTIRDFMFRPQALNDLTGIPSYDRFMLIFQSFGPAVYNIKYRKFQIKSVSFED